MASKTSVRELFISFEESINEKIVKKEEYKAAMARRNEKSDLMKNCYSKEDFCLLQEYLEIENEISSIEMEEAFVNGFSIAVELLIDSLM